MDVSRHSRPLASPSPVIPFCDLSRRSVKVVHHRRNFYNQPLDNNTKTRMERRSQNSRCDHHIASLASPFPVIPFCDLSRPSVKVVHHRRKFYKEVSAQRMGRPDRRRAPTRGRNQQELLCSSRNPTADASRRRLRGPSTSPRSGQCGSSVDRHQAHRPLSHRRLCCLSQEIW